MKPKVLFPHQWKGPGAMYGGELVAIRIFRKLLPLIHPIVVVESEGEFTDAARAVPCEVIVRDLGVLRRRHQNAAGLVNCAYHTLRAACWMARLIRREQVCLVFSCSVAVTAGAFAARMTSRPHIWLVQEVLSGPSRFLAPFVRRFSTRIITVGTAGAESILRGQRCLKDKIITAYPGVDVRKLDRADGTELRQIYGNTILIGMIGRIHSWKGQDYFFDALHHLKKRGIKGFLALIVGEVYPGNEQLKVDLQNKAKQLGLGDEVIFTGQLNNIENIFQAVDIVVAPSTLPEPFGLVVAEGMAARRPVISTNMGGPSEMIQDGISGFLVPPNDPKLFADRLEALIRDPELRKRLGAAGRQRIATDFSEEIFDRRIREIVSRMLQ